MGTVKKILFLVPYPLRQAPSQRFRVESFFPVIEKEEWKFTVCPFIDKKTWHILYQRGALFSKAWGLFKGYLRRWMIIFFKVRPYDYIFIHREAAPLGPPLFEWILAKLYRKKIIYDFDDAIWIPNTSSANQFINWFKAFWKVKYICRWSYRIAVGNDYLYNYAVQFNPGVVKIPTSVDINDDRPGARHNHNGRLNIGWTGSHSTLKYLDELVPVINDLQNELDFDFLVIADKNPLLAVKNYKFILWNAGTEVEDLLNLDIGVMPLVADSWSEGKCGFKLIQYFACGIPAVASPVGVNKIIVENGVNGFLCDSKSEWKRSLQKLAADEALRRRLGMAGRKKVRDQYSIQSQSGKFMGLFN